MHITTKIKGILAMADVTYGELGVLCDVSRQMIHNYLSNRSYEIEDCDKGLVVIDCVQKLNYLVTAGKLPLDRSTPKDQRINLLKELLSEVTA